MPEMVAGAVFCGSCENRGRRVSFAKFYVAGAVKTHHHGCYVLRSSQMARFLRQVILLELEVISRGQRSISYDLES